MTLPAIRVRIAFGVKPTEGAPAEEDWQDVTAYVRSVVVRRGRSEDLDKIEASTATVLLDNADGRFTPENTQSPYDPNILPMQQIEIAYQKADLSWAHRFAGFIEGWRPDFWNPTGGTVTATCVDLFRFFSLTPDLDASYGAQAAGPRIDAVLTDIGSLYASSVDAGGVAMSARAVTSNPLTYMQEVADVDGGLLRLRADGVIEFVARATLKASSTYIDVQATLGDGAGEIGYEAIEYAYDDTQVTNKVTGQISAEGEVVTYQDTASQEQYLLRQKAFGVTYQADQVELQSRLADFILWHRDPALRVSSLDCDVSVDGSDAQDLLALDLLHRIRVIRRPPAGDVLDAEYLIQGISDDIAVDAWKLGFDVSLAPPPEFILGLVKLDWTALGS